MPGAMERSHRTSGRSFRKASARLDANKDSSVDDAEFQAAADTLSSRTSGSASLAATDDEPDRGRRTGDVPRQDRKAQSDRIARDGQPDRRPRRRRGQGGGQGGGGRGQGGLGSGTFTMTAGDGKTGNMDAVYTTGPNAGEVCLGIYQLEGDTLQWCVSNRSGQRPNGMATGNGNWLLVLNKVPAQP